MKIFCVYDSKVSAWMQPFFFQHVGQALRAWEQLAKDPKSNVGMYPSDFTLFHIGSFDELSGAVTALESKVSYGLAIEQIKSSASISHIG